MKKSIILIAISVILTGCGAFEERSYLPYGDKPAALEYAKAQCKAEVLNRRQTPASGADGVASLGDTISEIHKIRAIRDACMWRHGWKPAN